MNIIAERRKQKAVCEKCFSPDYFLVPADPDFPHLKPLFRCGSCGNSWSFGYDGGKYMKLLKPKEAP